MIISKFYKWADKKDKEDRADLVLSWVVSNVIVLAIFAYGLIKLPKILPFHWLWLIISIVILMEILYWLPVIIRGKYPLPYGFTKYTYSALKKFECFIESFVLLVYSFGIYYIIKNYYEAIKEYFVFIVILLIIALVCIGIVWLFIKLNTLAINEKKRTGEKRIKRYICKYCDGSNYLEEKPKPLSKCKYCGRTNYYKAKKKKGWWDTFIDFLQEEDDDD